MRNTRALAVAGAAVAALGLSAPAAVAWETPSNITALPSVIAAGGQLTISVDGCRGGGTATSNAFAPTRLSPVHHAGKGNEGDRGGAGNNEAGGGSAGNGAARGTATINSNARPGSYDITVTCDGRTLTKPQAFTVLGGVRGGIGGSTTTGATPTDVAIGGGLVAAAVVGGGVFWMRRRAERRI
ncbi:hypothetical protein SAMN06272771_7042 [Streptomyces sp. Ag82_O1-12]|uniref:hypothetical protein n=1 Tax=unclassified Streptomyces TaxID=2593676 RepID=UPI000BD59F56|nr:MULTISPECIES: hypothetical protein [unclassified Streptomyces]SMQ20887.1 hypothetical protein SAMN06272771_7042 [Streptomyces sp. Ag82_O1-12]SOD49562.1 hypothetical protein SAMN06272727_7047 [Streptomyces sp. Ag82_G6-1]